MSEIGIDFERVLDSSAKLYAHTGEVCELLNEIISDIADLDTIGRIKAAVDILQGEKCRIADIDISITYLRRKYLEFEFENQDTKDTTMSGLEITSGAPTTTTEMKVIESSESSSDDSSSEDSNVGMGNNNINGNNNNNNNINGADTINPVYESYIDNGRNDMYNNNNNNNNNNNSKELSKNALMVTSKSGIGIGCNQPPKLLVFKSVDNIYFADNLLYVKNMDKLGKTEGVIKELYNILPGILGCFEQTPNYNTGLVHGYTPSLLDSKDIIGDVNGIMGEQSLSLNKLVKSLLNSAPTDADKVLLKIIYINCIIGMTLNHGVYDIVCSYLIDVHTHLITKLLSRLYG